MWFQLFGFRGRVQLIDLAFWSAIYQTIYDFQDQYFLANIKLAILYWFLGEVARPALAHLLVFVFTLDLAWVRRLAEYLGLGEP